MQHTSISPDRRVVAVVGDHVDALLMDSQNGKVTIFSFACCYSGLQFIFCVSLNRNIVAEKKR